MALDKFEAYVRAANRAVVKAKSDQFSVLMHMMTVSFGGKNAKDSLNRYSGEMDQYREPIDGDHSS